MTSMGWIVAVWGFFLEKAQRWVFLKVLRDPKDALLQTKSQQGIALSRPWLRLEGCICSILVWLCCCLGQWVRSDGDAGGQAADQIAITTRTVSKSPPLQEGLETSWLKDKAQSMPIPRFHTRESPKGLPASQILPEHQQTAQRGESLCIWSLPLTSALKSYLQGTVFRKRNPSRNPSLCDSESDPKL